MSAFWSGTDKTAIDEFDEGDFSFALVVNLKGEYKFRVSIWKPFAVHEDTELEILERKNRCDKKMKAEVKELCSKPSYNYTPWKKGKSNYTYGYRSSDQLLEEAAKDPRQERLPFNTTVRKTYTEIVEEIDGFNEDLIAGTITYSNYVKAIEDLNAELSKEHSMFKVNTIMKTQQDDLLHILPAQLVVYATSGDEVVGMYDFGYGIY
jgi:hypothetical protein